MWLAGALGLRNVDVDVADAAQLGDRLFGMRQRLAVQAVLVGDLSHSVALLGLGQDHVRASGVSDRLGVRGVDRRHVVTIDFDRVPTVGLGPLGVGVEVPAMHRLPGLAQTVHVDNRSQVVKAVEGGVLEGLPDGALRHLRVTAQHPDAVRQLVQPPAGKCHSHADGKTLPERARCNVHPGQDGRRMPLDAAAELAESEHLIVGDGTGRLVDRVQQRRCVPLAEDQVVVVRVARVPEVVVQVLGDQDGHQIGTRHRGRRMTRSGRRARADGVDAELLPELAPLVVVVRHSLAPMRGHSCAIP